MAGFKPLLSASADVNKDPAVLSKLKFPLIVSPKLDGIRNVVRGGRCQSRKLLDIPSKQVQEMFSHLEHMDGELIVGDVTDHDVYNRTQSFVMSNDKPASDLFYYVFDWAEESWAGRGFEERLDHLKAAVKSFEASGTGNVIVVEQRIVNSLEELLAAEEEFLSLGYEGIMMRSLNGPYKHGRSTFNEHTLIKLKRFQDDEAIVVGFVEQMRNENEAKKDELGHTKRSTNAEGMVPAGTLGKFLAKFGDLELEIPPGVLKKTERQHIWDHRDAFMGQTLKFRHFPHGAKDRPRAPRFIGWRTEGDMS